MQSGHTDLSQHMAKASKQRLRTPNNPWLRWGIYIIGFAPAIFTFWLAANNQLGANPVKEFEHVLGIWALRFLILTLCVTPLRDLFQLNFLPYRRALGLLAFYYATMHFATYLILDRGLDWVNILQDISQRNILIIGFICFVLLIPLALTSNQWSIRKLRQNWLRLHRLIYVIALGAALHFLLSVKSWPPEPIIYGMIIVALLLWRLVRKPYLRNKKAGLQ